MYNEGTYTYLLRIVVRNKLLAAVSGEISFPLKALVSRHILVTSLVETRKRFHASSNMVCNRTLPVCCFISF